MIRFIPSALLLIAATSLATGELLGYNQVGQDLFGAGANVEFGTFVALSQADGSRLAVGSPHHGWSTPIEDILFPNDDGGAFFIYDYDGSNWNLIWFLHGDDDEQIGNSMSISADGSRVAIRRHYSDPNYVEVYDINGNSPYSPVGSYIPSFANGDTVTLSPNGDRLAVSSESFSTFTGLVEIYELDAEDGDWVPIGTFYGLDNNDRFGWMTTFSNTGNRIAISSPSYDGGLLRRGLVRVFDFDFVTQTWDQVGDDLVGTNSNDRFGFSMDLSGDGSTLVIGSSGRIGSGDDRGGVGVYRFVSGSWILQANEIEGADNDRLGRSVAISDDGSRIAASSYFHDHQRGLVRLLELDGGVWTQLGSNIEGLSSFDRLGFGLMSVTLTGDGLRLASGAVLAADVLRGENDVFVSSGSVIVYDEVPATSVPSSQPSLPPSSIPTQAPTKGPSQAPSLTTQEPTISSSQGPSVATQEPTRGPTDAPSVATPNPTTPVSTATPETTIRPSSAPSSAAMPESSSPTAAPTETRQDRGNSIIVATGVSDKSSAFKLPSAPITLILTAGLIAIGV